MTSHQHIVAALVERGEEILLVQHQAPRDPAPAWALPGGVVEEGETLLEALRRELCEEADIEEEAVGPLLYVCEVQDEEAATWALTFVFRIDRWSGEPKATGRDEFVLEARMFPRQEVSGKLASLPERLRFMREPVVEWLQGGFDSARLYCYKVRQGTVMRLYRP